MVDDDDILDFMDSEAEDVKEEYHKENSAKKTNKGSGAQFENKNWDAVFDPLIVEPSMLSRGSRQYLAISNEGVPDSVLERVRVISKKLKEMGYTHRDLASPSRDKMNGVATLGAEDKVAIYTAWAGYGKDDINDRSKIVVHAPSEKAYRIATKYNTSFNKLKPAIRAFIARDMAALLGEDSNTPIDFLLCWTENGEEKKKELTTNTGKLRNMIYLCNEFNIPVFNLGKSDAIDRFKQYLKSHN